MPQCVAHIRSSYNFKPVSLQSFLQHHPNSVIIFDDEGPVCH